MSGISNKLKKNKKKLLRKLKLNINTLKYNIKSYYVKVKRHKVMFLGNLRRIKKLAFFFQFFKKSFELFIYAIYKINFIYTIIGFCIKFLMIGIAFCKF